MSDLFNKNSEKTIIDWYGFKYQTSLHTDGGIIDIHKGVITALDRIFGDKVWDNVLDWCAGDGGVGMMLLGAGLAKKISFVEPYSEALQHLRSNLDRNKIDANVFDVDKIQNLDGKYDLVIANPPNNRIPTLQHMYHDGWLRKNAKDPLKYEDALEDLNSKTPHRKFDFFWKVHIEFFKNIEKNLNQGADVILLENPTAFNPLFWEWGPTNLKLKCWVDNNQVRGFPYPQAIVHLKYE